MFDWYLILTPLFAALIFLGLVALKLSLQDQPEISDYSIQKIKTKQAKNSQEPQQAKASLWQTNQYFKTYAYLIKNHSFLEMCVTRKAKNKLPIVLSFMAIGVLSLFFGQAYYLCVIGIFFVIIFVIVQSFLERNPTDIIDGQQEQFAVIRQQVKDQSQKQQKKRYLYISYGVLISGLGLFICSTVFKNYLNSFLETFAATFAINSALDIFIVRPIGFILLSVPIKFSSKIQNFITNENFRVQLSQLTSKIEIRQCATNMSPRKKQANSPTKVPKAILRKHNSQNQTLINAMQAIKKIKKQKNQFGGLMTPLGKNKVSADQSALEEYSLNQLFEQDKSVENSLQQTPVAHFNFQESSCNQSRIKGKRRDSDLIILEFNNKNEEENESQRGEKICQNPLNFIHSNLDEEDISQIPASNRNDGEQDLDNNVKIIKLLDRKSLPCSDDEQSGYTRNSKNNENFLTIQQQRTNGLMCINQQGDEQREIQQIDLNSPTKRARKAEQVSQQIASKHKKAKHPTNNAKRRVIKFTSGEPYLEYLPNMLSKETNKHTKRSQPINFKSQFEVEDERQPRKSLRKIKKQVRGGFNNDQNQCPDAMYIQDL